MVKLIAQHPLSEALPKKIGSVSFTAHHPDKITSIAPYEGQGKAVSDALNAALLMRFPSPNRALQSQAGRLIWAGKGVALLFDADVPDIANLAATTDQSDAWAIVRIDGPQTEDILARLVPIDLAKPAFKVGHTARTMVGHMTGTVTRIGPQAFEIMVMRSMASTLLHDLTRAAKGVAARVAGEATQGEAGE